MGAIVLDGPWTGQSFTPPTPLDIATLEAAVVGRLSAQVAGVEVAHFPDRPEAYRLTHRVGAVLVRYEGAGYGKLIDSAAIVQERTLKFEVAVMMRDLGWNTGGAASGSTPGAYAIIEAVRAALTGYRVPGCEKAYPLGERFVRRDREGGVWIYSITFALRTVAVEPGTLDSYPLLLQARAQERGGITALGAAAAQYTFGANGQVQLAQGNVAAVQVANPGSGINYTAGVDYTVDAVNGTVTALPGGALTNGGTVSIVYTYSDVVTAIAGAGSAPTAPSN